MKSIQTDDRVLSSASLFSVAHDYAIETTLAEFSDGSHRLRIEGDLVDVATSDSQTITAAFAVLTVLLVG